MISNLHIKNIGIIDDLVVDLNTGLNVLTGETGAGKTLIIDSLGIIAGGRFQKEMIRRGQDHSFVELCIYLPEHEMAIDGNIILSREIYSNGRNLCKINGRLVTVNELKTFMKNIIDIHGQQDNQTILDPNSHIKYLDNFTGKNLQTLKTMYDEYYKQYIRVKNELKNNYGDDIEKQRRLDLLKYQQKEIENCQLKIGEDEELENIRSKILNEEKISSNLKQIDIDIGENAIDSISSAIRALEKIEILDEKYSEKLNNLKSIYYDLQELSRDITILKEEIEFDEEQRQTIEARLDLIYSLKRKYGNNIDEIIRYQEDITKQIEQIENLDEYIVKLKQEEKEIKNKMIEICIEMNKMRKESSEVLSKQINQQLQDLEMKNAKFEVQIYLDENYEFNSNGLDKVEFFIRTNIGEEKKPLVKIASGGEMSRIMLAIKNVLADIDEVPILVFDEIDTGISGIAANSVADKMKQIAKNHQVLCITHLASIAAKGDYNYYISKEVIDNNTKTKIELLSEEDAIKEIARISSGNITDIALEHARELRKY
ncbi:MAG: DNA repair protein RecN [Clostridia bacterium]|jgi:DNA repair protein RecN (Recombination protein N)|nr:DNA repair protein RecN [Clostridia bacterium]